MATRDLSRSFLQLRADAKAKSLRRKNIVSHSDEGNALMKNGDSASHALSVAPGWVDVVNETNQHVASIKAMSTSICVVPARTRAPALVASSSSSKPACIRAAHSLRLSHSLVCTTDRSGQAAQTAHKALDGAL